MQCITSKRHIDGQHRMFAVNVNVLLHDKCCNYHPETDCSSVISLRAHVLMFYSPGSCLTRPQRIAYQQSKNIVRYCYDSGETRGCRGRQWDRGSPVCSGMDDRLQCFEWSHVVVVWGLGSGHLMSLLENKDCVERRKLDFQPEVPKGVCEEQSNLLKSMPN